MSSWNDTLKKIIMKIDNLDVEHGYLVNSSGKILFKTTDNKERNVWIGDKLANLTSNVIRDSTFIHNHPVNYFVGNIPVLSSLSVYDLATNAAYDMNATIAVDPIYIYTVKRPKSGYGKFVNRTFTKYYWDISDKLQDEMKKQILDGKMSIRNYEENLEHLIAKQVCNHFGWIYSRTKNPYSDFKISLKGEVLQYADIPKWIKQSKNPNKKKLIESYRQKFMAVMNRNPELKEFYDYPKK